MTSAETRDQAFVDKMLTAMAPKFGALEQALEGRDYILGDFTIADTNVVVQTFVVIDQFAVDLAEFPNVRAWTARCRARPARRSIDAVAAAGKKT